MNPKPHQAPYSDEARHVLRPVSRSERGTSAAFVVGAVFFSALTAANLLLSCAQLVAYSGDVQKLTLLVWLQVLALGQVAVCVGAWRRDAWARSWSRAVASFQFLRFGYLAAFADPPLFALVGLSVCAALAAVAYLALRLAAGNFAADLELSPDDGGLLETPPKLDYSAAVVVALIVVTALCEYIGR